MLRQIGFLSIAMLSFSFVHVAWAGSDSSKMAALTTAKPDTGETKSASDVIAPQVAAVLGAATSIPASGMATGGIGAELSAISARLESSHAPNPNAPLIWVHRQVGMISIGTSLPTTPDLRKTCFRNPELASPFQGGVDARMFFLSEIASGT